LLFDLACATAREELVLSYPRVEPATARPRVPSFLLLEHTGARDFKALDKLAVKYLPANRRSTSASWI